MNTYEECYKCSEIKHPESDGFCSYCEALGKIKESQKQVEAFRKISTSYMQQNTELRELVTLTKDLKDEALKLANSEMDIYLDSLNPVIEWFKDNKHLLENQDNNLKNQAEG